MNCLDMVCPCELVEHCPANHEEVAYHTETIVDGELTIPDYKPPCEKIINITRKICITKVVPVPVKLNNGCVAGCKVLVAGSIRLGFEYSADVPEQNVHFVHFDVPFQALILGGPCHKPIPLRDCNLKKFKLNVCVEHIQAELISPRDIEKVVVLLLWLERKDCETPEPCRPPRYGHKHEHEHDYDYEYNHDHDCGSNHDHGCNHDHECNHDHGQHHACPPAPCDSMPDVSKQISINHTLNIPAQKPPAECVLDSSVEIDVTKAEVIDTPLVSEHCHQPLKKVVIVGKAEITVKYVADVPNQQVHAAVFRVPFEALIQWPGGPPQHSPVCVSVVVEHFQVDLLDDRRLFVVLIIRLDVSEK